MLYHNIYFERLTFTQLIIFVSFCDVALVEVSGFFYFVKVDRIVQSPHNHSKICLSSP